MMPKGKIPGGDVEVRTICVAMSTSLVVGSCGAPKLGVSVRLLVPLSSTKN